MDISSIAIQGVQQAEVQLDAAASNIVPGEANGADPNVASMSADMVSLMTAQNQFSLNLAALATADEVQQSLLDVMA